MRFIKIALFDLKRGLREEWIKFVFAFLVCIACCFLMCFQLSIYKEANGINKSVQVSMMDFILYNLRGMKLYSPNMDGEHYFLPAVWMLNQVMIALIVGYFPVRDLCGYGKNTLLRTKSRSKWFCSKIIWTACMVVMYYAVIYFSTFVFCVFSGNSLSFMPSEYVTYLFYDIELNNIYIENFVLSIIMMPLLTSIVASVVQVVLSYIINPYTSFLTTIVLMLSSTYVSSPALIGNASMIIRSKFATPVGLSIEECLLSLALYLTIALLFGFLYFRKKDILYKG